MSSPAYQHHACQVVCILQGHQLGDAPDEASCSGAMLGACSNQPPDVNFNCISYNIYLLIELLAYNLQVAQLQLATYRS